MNTNRVAQERIGIASGKTGPAFQTTDEWFEAVKRRHAEARALIRSGWATELGLSQDSALVTSLTEATFELTDDRFEDDRSDAVGMATEYLSPRLRHLRREEIAEIAAEAISMFMSVKTRGASDRLGVR
jgi:hypothetical protein